MRRMSVVLLCIIFTLLHCETGYGERGTIFAGIHSEWVDSEWVQTANIGVKTSLFDVLKLGAELLSSDLDESDAMSFTVEGGQFRLAWATGAKAGKGLDGFLRLNAFRELSIGKLMLSYNEEKPVKGTEKRTLDVTWQASW